MSETQKLPPPSFALIVASFAAQASVALGQMPNPMTNKQEVNLELAKHAIDTLAILEQKTKGNLTADETDADGVSRSVQGGEGVKHACHRRPDRLDGAADC